MLRTLSTTRLVAACAAVVALFAAVATIAVASGGGGATPPPKPLAEAVNDAISAPPVDGVAATVTFTNKLFPTGAPLGSAGPALVSSGTGRMWATGDGRGRIELQSSSGDAQIVWTKNDVTVYEPSSSTAYHASLPATKPEPPATDLPPTLSRVTELITQLEGYATVSRARPTNIAGAPAYSATVAPKHDGGLLGSVELAWDASHGVPLRVAVYARDGTAPVIELAATHVTYGSIDSAAVDVAPPSDARIVEIGSLTPAGAAEHDAGVTGLAAVRAAAGFDVTAPDTLAGLPRRGVRLVGDAESHAAIVTYGQGLGAIIVVERKAVAGGGSHGILENLPTVSLDGVSAHEVATQLGTILTWESNGVATTIAGSIVPAAAEAAARELG